MAAYNTTTSRESDSRISQLSALETHTPSLVFYYPCMGRL